jgi:hypothetical protein
MMIKEPIHRVPTLASPKQITGSVLRHRPLKVEVYVIEIINLYLKMFHLKYS